MSAEILRRAAATMRERAEAATPGPWAFEAEGDSECGEPACCSEYWDNRIWGGGVVIAESHLTSAGDSQHIASWHPAVALAVAQFLATEAAHAERGGVDWNDPDTTSRNALAVARAYLGSES